MNGNSNVWRRETIRWRSCRRRRSISKDKIYTPVYLHVKRGVRIAEIGGYRTKWLKKKIIYSVSSPQNDDIRFFRIRIYFSFFLLLPQLAKAIFKKEKKHNLFLSRDPQISRHLLYQKSIFPKKNRYIIFPTILLWEERPNLGTALTQLFIKRFTDYRLYILMLHHSANQ